MGFFLVVYNFKFKKGICPKFNEHSDLLFANISNISIKSY